MSEPIWQPSAAAIASSRLTEFTQQVEGKRATFGSYAALHRWSTDSADEFWQEFWDYAGIIAQQSPRQTLADRDKFPGARWFPGSRLNYAENLLRYSDDHPALVSLLETGERQELTYRQLTQRTAKLASALRTMGLKPGDRVAAWLPNVAESVIAMLAVTSVGAVWSSCSPDFGISGALDRFGQIAPKLLIACDGYHYNGKRHNTQDKVREVAANVDSIERILWLPLLGDLETADTDITQLWSDISPAIDPLYEPRNFDDPLYILYSSGTTGKPKCIVHGLGGTLLQHMKEHQLHIDLRRKDRLFFFTTCGWMMWNWVVSALATGSTLVLYDGSPLYPNPGRLVDLAAAERVTVFGVSAKYLGSIDKAQLKPAATHDLDSMRMLISTGSPLTDEGYDYVYRDIKSDVHLVSMSGGTDIVSCFVIGNPNAPVYRGEIQCAGLGMAVEVWNEAGERVIGQKGELVCTRSFPSCPIEFWNDPDQQRFRAAYFEQYQNIGSTWAQGDFAEETENGGFIIYGRSDAILNPGGVRIGTAEIYRQVERFDAIVDAVCVVQQWQDDTRVLLFVVMATDETFTEQLATAVKTSIRQHASPRHVPAIILPVADIPRTMSGKIAELAVRAVIHEQPVKNTSALANPEALENFRGLAELRET